ncbi:MAG: hypothetical protein H3C62_05310 [Gemmatimonadaceae bacterium]|nr:hypothetical protein [Gemmatimonadaceae bacterium]
MTAPVVPTVPIFPPPPPPPAPVAFPLGWILDNAALPIQYRSATEVAKLGDALPASYANTPYFHRPAVEIAVRQSYDGTWNGAMLALPSKGGHDGLGSVNAVRRLLECGWDKDSPAVYQARRALFRLLAEDEDEAQLYEFQPKSGKHLEPELAAHYRQLLREAAGATLAQAGFESDPRVRGLARRSLERVWDYLQSPLAQKPWVRSGNQQVLAAEASPPSLYLLQMLAHMPLFRSEYYTTMEALYEYLTRPLPRQESVQMVGRKLLPVPLFVLGDMLPHRNAVDADIPMALAWLETMARLNFLRRNENWSKLFERFVDDCGRDGVWHPHKGMATPKTTNPFVWPFFPLETSAAGDERWTDVTFRIGLIARLSGRGIELV